MAPGLAGAGVFHCTSWEAEVRAIKNLQAPAPTFLKRKPLQRLANAHIMVFEMGNFILKCFGLLLIYCVCFQCD